ncbi:MAG: hypothetical protein GY866_29660 [Proteobacteria bacterium]|nr:hypothetical protein [Pseudomonadota bacterium]
MMFKIEDTLPLYEVSAENYAHSSDNKIHSPGVAKNLGFSGGLVPGVGIYAYMAHPLITVWGTDWLKQGAMKAKFLKPVYEGEKISVQCQVSSLEPLTVEIEVRNPNRVLCALGTASLGRRQPEPNMRDYPSHPLPAYENRLPPEAAALTAGSPVGSVPLAYHPDDNQAYFFEEIRDALAELTAPEPMHHPAFMLHSANRLAHFNIGLGPWIHTASDVQHYDLPVMNSELSMNGKILEAYQRRGHDYVVLDLAVFAERSRPIAKIVHTAIIRPKGV